jgi:hypothetical protein
MPGPFGIWLRLSDYFKKTLVETQGIASEEILFEM